MSERKEDRSPKTVTRTEFVQNASTVLRRAGSEGPILVVNDRGEPSMAIYSPTDRLPFTLD